MSQIISKGWFVFDTSSKTGTKSCFTRVIFLSVNKTYGFSNTISIRSLFVTKYAEINPRSNPIPSVISNSVAVDLLSSNDISPSLPTLSIALAIKDPTVESFPADIFATCVISEMFSTGRA